MIRIDGSEYSEKHAIARLIGAPPGYVGHESGGQLTEYVRRKPYCIILIDEIEKASHEFVTLFLQVLDDGRLTDGQGRVVDFRNTVIIMTSNLGAAFLGELGEGPISAHTKQLVMGAVQAHFPPEFINRIDEIIIYVSFCTIPHCTTLNPICTLTAYAVEEQHTQDRGSPAEGNSRQACGSTNCSGCRCRVEAIPCVYRLFTHLRSSSTEPHDSKRAAEPIIHPVALRSYSRW